jgi:RHS repeat-associated protein
VQTGVVYSYDSMGRPTGYWQCTPYNCGSASIWSMPYTYDLAGDVHTWTHPSTYFYITNTISAAQRVTQISSSFAGSPPNLAQSITYTPWGAVHTLENGCAGSGCTDILETDTYNNRLQPVMIELQKTSDSSHNYCLVYNYYSGSNPASCAVPSPGINNNGNVMGYWYSDNINSSQSHTAAYGYDNLNRLATAEADDLSIYHNCLWGVSSTPANNGYDRWGNLLNRTLTCGTATTLSRSVDANNHISGFSYDAAGNTTGDGLTNYQWDAEGRLQSVNNGAFRSYVYNALGREVEWHGDGRVSEDLTDLGGHYLGSVDPSSGAWTGERIPGDKIYLAWYVNGGTTFFHYNALGSSMMNTHQDGNTVSNDVLFYPWGQLWASLVNAYFQFFGNIEGWDWEEGKGVTPNRYYPNYQGRWLSPDTLADDISNPQSLNRYAYVLNNPTRLTDPTGLGPCDNLSFGQGKGDCLKIGYSASFDGGIVGDTWSDSLYLLSLSSGQAAAISNADNSATYLFDIAQAVQGTSANTALSPDWAGWPAVTENQLFSPLATDWILSGVVYGTTDSGSGGILSSWAPGSLAPAASGLMNAIKAATRQVQPKVPKPLPEIPGEEPPIQLEDPFMKNILQLMTKWLRGGGSGPLPPSTLLVPIVSPCVIPSIQSLPSCGGWQGGGGMY